MSAFVAELTASVSGNAVTFLKAVVSDYWLTILSVLFVGFMIALFWRLAYKIFGARK